MKMADKKDLIIEISDKLAVIRLSRPGKKNAINGSMYEGITSALESISNNNEITITVITGSGDYYCSGTDLQEGLNSGFESTNQAVKLVSNRLRKFVEAFINHNKILVAVVNGPAIGIGVTTLALCDIVYCSDTATFQTPFTKLGMTAEGSSTYTFPRLMGTAKANEMLLFGKKLTAKEAYDVGLVSQVYTKEQIDTVLWPNLRKNAIELPLKSLQYSKQMIRRFDIAKLHEANRQECERLEERWTSEDCMNAVLSFLNRRSKM